MDYTVLMSAIYRERYDQFEVYIRIYIPPFSEPPHSVLKLALM